MTHPPASWPSTGAHREDAARASVPDRLLDAAEVAELLHVPQRWVQEASRDGRIPCLRLGRYVRYRWDAIEAWLVECESSPPAWRRHRPVRETGTK